MRLHLQPRPCHATPTRGLATHPRVPPVCRAQVQQQPTIRVEGPPADYDFRADIMPETLEVVRALHPELLPIVERGSLVVYRRPPSYVERRSDGYREPELIWLLGTAHVSATSAAEVEAVVQAVRPENVVVELCRSRSGLLSTPPQPPDPHPPPAAAAGSTGGVQQQLHTSHATAAAASSSSSSSSSMDSTEDTPPTMPSSATIPPPSSTSSSSSSRKATNPWSLTGPSFFPAVARSVSLGGQSSLLLRLLLARQAARAAEALGAQSGDEFRAAAAAAEVVGAQLVLGDRPVEITLDRAWGALGWRGRLGLLGDLARGAAGGLPKELTPALVEASKQDDAITAATAQLAATYPALLPPLVHERDLYLAWSCKRSKAVNGTRQVVGVVGKGHLRGVVYALKHDSGNLRFADLVGGKNTRAAKQAAAAAAWKRLGVELVLGAGLAAAWQLWSSSSGVGLWTP